jgi:hypothetical protein
LFVKDGLAQGDPGSQKRRFQLGRVKAFDSVQTGF